MIEQQVCIGGPSVIVTAAWLLDLYLWGVGSETQGQRGNCEGLSQGPPQSLRGPGSATC